MFRIFSSALGGVRTLIQVAACLLIGGMMVFVVGIPLAIGGRPEAWVPLIIGSIAFVTAGRHVWSLVR